MNRALRTDTGLLLLRLVVGSSFLLHGIDKLKDVDKVKQTFDGLGIPAPELMAPFVTATETVGGILLLLGLLTPLAGMALSIDMLVAGLTAHTGKGFFVADGGYELVLLLGIACLGIAVLGAGRFSVDASVLRRPQIPAWMKPIRAISAQEPTTS